MVKDGNQAHRYAEHLARMLHQGVELGLELRVENAQFLDMLKTQMFVERNRERGDLHPSIIRARN
jgi:hypothetical protein